MPETPTRHSRTQPQSELGLLFIAAQELNEERCELFAREKMCHTPNSASSVLILTQESWLVVVFVSRQATFLTLIEFFLRQ